MMQLYSRFQHRYMELWRVLANTTKSIVWDSLSALASISEEDLGEEGAHLSQELALHLHKALNIVKGFNNAEIEDTSAGYGYSLDEPIVYVDDQEDNLVGSYNSAVSVEQIQPTEQQIDINKSRNWNADFQNLLDRIDDTRILDFDDEFKELSSICSDFVSVSEMFAKIIISERFLAQHLKTIESQRIGGIAGGLKYVCHNIIFKFAIDSSGLYGGDKFASKVAGHELRCLSQFQTVQKDIRTPLSCLIDYKGFRLVAVAALPLDRLIYGSDDCGKTIHNDSETFNVLMKRACESLNLASHTVCSLSGVPEEISGAFDLEGHLGKDGRFYCLDFSRLFPCVPPDTSRNRNSHLFQMFRPELVRNFEVPLCSDSFLSLNEDLDRIHQDNSVKAFDKLQNVMIPDFANMLQGSIVNVQNLRLGPASTLELSNQTLQKTLSALAHQHGINIRYLGQVRTFISEKSWQRFILSELVARVMKHDFNKRLRDKMRATHYVGDEPNAFLKVAIRLQ